jgi:hypothetical protein
MQSDRDNPLSAIAKMLKEISGEWIVQSKTGNTRWSEDGIFQREWKVEVCNKDGVVREYHAWAGVRLDA